MQLAVRGQALDSRDLGAVLHDGKGQARDDAPSVDENGAGPALAVVAAFLGSGEIEIFAKRVEKCGPRPEGNSALDAVDAKRDVALRWRRKLARVWLVFTQRHPDLPFANADMQTTATGQEFRRKLRATELQCCRCRASPSVYVLNRRSYPHNNSRPLVARCSLALPPEEASNCGRNCNTGSGQSDTARGSPRSARSARWPPREPPPT